MPPSSSPARLFPCMKKSGEQNKEPENHEDAIFDGGNSTSEPDLVFVCFLTVALRDSTSHAQRNDQHENNNDGDSKTLHGSRSTLCHLFSAT